MSDKENRNPNDKLTSWGSPGDKDDEQKSPVCSICSILCSWFGIVFHIASYGAGHGMSFEGFGLMMLGFFLGLLSIIIAGIFMLVAICRVERPFVVLILAIVSFIFLITRIAI